MLYHVVCDVNHNHVLSDIPMAVEDAIRHWGSKHLTDSDEGLRKLWVSSKCCDMCHVLEHNSSAAVNEIKRVYCAGYATVTVHDVYFQYDNLARKGDFQGKVDRVDVTRSIDGDGRATITAALWVRLHEGGHANKPRFFHLGGMHPQPDRAGHTIEWVGKLVFAVVKEEIEVSCDSRWTVPHMSRVFLGTKCDAGCKKKRSGKCAAHTLRRARLV